MNETVDLKVCVLASGSGSRFGSAKQLALISDRTLLEIALDKARTLDDYPIVTLGAHLHQIKAELGDKLSDCQVVNIVDWEEGLSRSFTGIAKQFKTDEDNSHFLVMLADQPGILVDDLRTMWAIAQKYPEEIVACEYGEKRLGVPAIFPRRYLKHFEQLSGDRGAKQILNQEKVIPFQVRGSLMDIDTRDDLETFISG